MVRCVQAADASWRRVAVLLTSIWSCGHTCVDGLELAPCSPAMGAYLAEVLSGGPPNFALEAYLGIGACLLDTTTGFTPLHQVASRGGNLAGALVAMLVDRSASVLEKDANGATALHVASSQGSFLAAAAICEQASRAGILQKLLPLGQGKNGEGSTALDLAEAAGHWREAKLLVELGAPRKSSNDVFPQWWADTDAAISYCPSPIVDAVLLGDAQRATELLDAYASGRATLASNDSSQMMKVTAVATTTTAAASPAAAAAASALVGDSASAAKFQASVEALARCVVPPLDLRRTLLHVATAAAGISSVAQGSTSRRLSAKSESVVELLLSRRADAAQADSGGAIPLAIAASADLHDVVDALLANSGRGSANVADALGRTALHEAAKAGSERAVRVLLANGALPWLEDDLGFSPLDYAKREGHLKVVESIEQVLSLQSAPSLESIFVKDEFPAFWEEDVDSAISVFAPTVGVVAGLVVAMLAAIALWHRSYRNRKTAVSALDVGEGSVDKEHRIAEQQTIRSVARGHLQPRSVALDSSDRKFPPGQISGHDTSSNSEDDHHESSQAGNSSRHRKRTSKTPGDSPDQPIVVVAPDTPKAGRHGRPCAGSDGEISNSGSPLGSHAEGRSGSWPSNATADGSSPQPPLISEISKTDHDARGPLPKELVGQLRAELRQRDQHQLGSSSGIGPLPAAMQRIAQASSVGGSPAAKAALARLPTPPMNTSEPMSLGQRPLGASLQQPAKRAHGAPQPRGKTEAFSQEVAVALPAALQGLASAGTEVLPARKADKSSRSSSSTRR